MLPSTLLQASSPCKYDLLDKLDAYSRYTAAMLQAHLAHADKCRRADSLSLSRRSALRFFLTLQQCQRQALLGSAAQSCILLQSAWIPCILPMAVCSDGLPHLHTCLHMQAAEVCPEAVVELMNIVLVFDQQRCCWLLPQGAAGLLLGQERQHCS